MARKVLKVPPERKPPQDDFPVILNESGAPALGETGAPPMGVSRHRAERRFEGREGAASNLAGDCAPAAEPQLNEPECDYSPSPAVIAR